MAAHEPERLWQQLTARCPLAGEGCPSPVELQAFAAGELDPARRDSIAVLVGNCAQCAAGVRLALAAELEFPEAESESPAAEAPGELRLPPAAKRSTFWLGTGAAVLVLLAVAGVWLRTPGAGPSADVLRGESVSALSPPAGARLSTPPVFRWPAGGGSCRVQVRDGSGNLVLSSRAIDAQEQAAAADLPDGHYQWTLMCTGAAPRGPYGFDLVR